MMQNIKFKSFPRKWKFIKLCVEVKWLADHLPVGGLPFLHVLNHAIVDLSSHVDAPDKVHVIPSHLL